MTQQSTLANKSNWSVDDTAKCTCKQRGVLTVLTTQESALVNKGKRSVDDTGKCTVNKEHMRCRGVTKKQKSEQNRCVPVYFR